MSRIIMLILRASELMESSCDFDELIDDDDKQFTFFDCQVCVWPATLLRGLICCTESSYSILAMGHLIQ